MDKAFKKKWLRALNSGKYKKANGTLRRKSTGGFCCLGVACDLTDPNGWERVCGHREYEFGYGVNMEDAFLPRSLREALGITGSEERMLVFLNDRGRGWTKVIKYIKEEL